MKKVMKDIMKDIFTDRKGKYDGFKFTYMAGFAVMTFLMIYTVMRGQLTFDLIVAYMGLIGGTSMVSKSISAKKENKKEGAENE